jgi:hypothetical protein
VQPALRVVDAVFHEFEIITFRRYFREFDSERNRPLKERGLSNREAHQHCTEKLK